MKRFTVNILADFLALAVVAGVILLASAAVQKVWPAESQGCEAATMILLADREKARRKYERDCLDASGDRDNQFAPLMCEAPR
jgi:hypothetical protein